MTEGVGSATASKAIELTVDFGALAGYTPTMTGAQAKAQVLAALEKIAEYIEQTHSWPPA